MKTFSCIIIEDEFPAVELLKGYLKNFDNWHLDAVFNDPIEAINHLNTNHVDVLFLDIQLPKLSGMELLKTIGNLPPYVVITSAYSEHAVSAFELTVFDYLLKPYSFQRFLKTIQRIQSDHTNPIENSRTLSFRENRQTVKVKLDSILFVESQREYLKIQHQDGILKTKMALTKLCELLPDDAYVRIHRSYIIFLDKIERHSATTVTINGTTLPIGRHYKKEALERIENKRD